MSLFHPVQIGMSEHDRGDLAAAMAAFEKALAALLPTGNASRIGIAQWMIAWTMRLQGRLDEALAAQQSLAAEPKPSGYVFEELGEILLLKGHSHLAKENFARAWPLLEYDLAGTDRLARMKSIAQK